MHTLEGSVVYKTADFIGRNRHLVFVFCWAVPQQLFMETVCTAS